MFTLLNFYGAECFGVCFSRVGDEFHFRGLWLKAVYRCGCGEVV